MNIWDHSRLSKRKFGGVETDYFAIHKFLDSSKLFYFHAKHRLLLHQLYGIEITILKFGDYIKNTDGRTILVRDIAAEHLKEDLSGKVPTLYEWLVDNEPRLNPLIQIPEIKDDTLKAFVLTPYIRTNLKAALLITLSDFGVYLTKEILGFSYATQLLAILQQEQKVAIYLSKFRYTQHWQFSPDRKELEWLKQQDHGH